jgi:tripartite-type tricarboxylate transporter receptor subunit TctC
LNELVLYAKQNPGRLNYGTPGAGSLAHMLGETFKWATKTELVHVPYKGAGPALNDTLAGQVQVLFDNLPSSLPHVQAGKLRALAVASAKRIPALPDVPTFGELGLPALNDPSWFGLIGPAGLPGPLAERLHAALVQVLAQPEVVQRLEALAAVPVGNSPDEFRRVVAQAIDTNRRVAAEAKLKFD